MINEKYYENEYKGHFTIQSMTSDGDIIDEYNDDNLIVTTSRTSIAELFAGISLPSVNKIVIGTSGYNGVTSVPKSSAEGLVRERTRIFSESVDVTDGTTTDLVKNDLVRYTGSTAISGVLNNYYRYIGSGELSVDTSTIDFTTSDWIDVGGTGEYSYPFSFDLPGTSNGAMTNIVESETGSSASIIQDGRDVTFTFTFGNAAGNGVGTEQITEAGLYCNNRLFSIKTFPTKPKDATVILRIIWKISF